MTLLQRLLGARRATDKHPSEAQKEAGNYRKGKLSFHGLTIALENPKGSLRSGVGANGEKWSTRLTADYGYVVGVDGKDGDGVDVFIGPDHDSELVFVVDQVKPESGRFDEHKVILATDSEEEARALYLSNYMKGWKGLGDITPLTVAEFRAWLEHHDTTKPMASKKVAPRDVFKAEPMVPGARGGRYYRTKTGRIRYGEKPTKSVVTLDQVRVAVEASKRWPEMPNADRMEILMLPNVYRTWQRMNPGWHVERASNEKYGPGFVVYREYQGACIPWNSVKDEWYSHSPQGAWNGVTRETKHRFIENLLYAALGHAEPEPSFTYEAQRHGLKVVASTNMPAGFTIGDRFELSSGEVVTAVGAEDGMVRVTGVKGREFISPDAVNAGRILRKAQRYDLHKRPEAHDHGHDAEEPVIVLDLNGTLTPSKALGPEGVEPPLPGVKEALSHLKAGGACLHLATALLSPMHAGPDVLAARRRQIEGWIAQHGLPIDFVTGKVLASVIYDDRMIRADRSWDVLLTEIVRRIEERYKRAEAGLWKRIDKSKVGELFDFPDSDKFDEDHPRGLVGVILDVDMHRCLTEASSSTRKARPRPGAVVAMRALYDAGVTIHISCAGWDPSTRTAAQSKERLAGMRQWCSEWGIKHDQFVTKDHGTVFVDNQGFAHTDWATDLPVLFRLLRHEKT